ncbi:uncharacterized protein [Physcomitrium patens]|uniref:GRIP domain-containing protein n=1 Tax=Physcomitrium patens TaxID=3218 RepID=A0A2K1JQU3_PHYPA|nr:golgin candidate 4-like isoform X2 [Physcomitrium patens]PNR43902.1 hypothetical protein PHYPA_016285 [Physcomitrium patens]|eukprot:XP_024391625.1 golgin candidate 4-like isoform X2 [Physcomitrella patens]
MWSRFEKLKDNITQIASDVLDSQDELDGEGAPEDGSFEGYYNEDLKSAHTRDSDDEGGNFPPTELDYYNDKGDKLQIDPEAAMKKYNALLEEKEMEVSILREENKLLKEQFLINSTKRDALFNDQNKERMNGHFGDLKEHLQRDEASVEKEDREPEIEKVLDDNSIVANRFESPQTIKLELSSSDSEVVNGLEESVPLLSEVESKDDKFQDTSSVEELNTPKAEDEQVVSLSEKLRASEEVCCSLQKRLEDVSIERDALSNKLEDVSIERDELSKKLEEISLEPEILPKKLEDALLERDTLVKKVEELSIERDKAIQNLGRLRQNLLDMESTTSEKMDNDSFLIGDLELRLKTAEDCVGQLQQALAKSQDELEQAYRKNVLRTMDTNEEMELLKQRLQTCSEALEAKDMELANLQSALGQYYAESDAQERLESELRAVKELNARLTRDLKIAEGTIDLKVQELEAVTKKLGNADSVNEELKHNMHTLEQQVLKLRAALEQSITSLNRMSSDSDFYVDRRIVIKLLVTYFERHHSREVLDLMVRMLGFSEEDKRRVGVAQQSARGGGMVRSVFGMPGRIVGGILGGSESDPYARPTPGDNQSFADLWIDFLLKESQERERRERGGGGINPAPGSPMANVTRSMPSSPSGGQCHRPSHSFSNFPSPFLPPRPNRVSSSSDLQTIPTGDP